MPVGKTATADVQEAATYFAQSILANVDSVDFDNENAGFSPQAQQLDFFTNVKLFNKKNN